MNKLFYTMAVLASSLAFAQTGKVGINTENPTETLQINGSARITDLPINGTANSISTNANGTASESKNQSFNATKTLVVDNNGVVGAIEGLPSMNTEEVRTVQYASKMTTIDDYTPTTSELRLGNIKIRFDGTYPKGGQQKFSIQIPDDAVLYDSAGYEAWGDNVIISGYKVGWGGLSGVQDYTKSITKGNTWTTIDYNVPDVWRNDTVQYMIVLVNTGDVYRFTASVNTTIDYNERTTPYGSPAQVMMFLERMTSTLK